MTVAPSRISVAIACGGTGGHLFPGLAVAGQLRERDCAVTLFVSPKDVDQRAVKGLEGMQVMTLPAVAFQSGSRLAFFRASLESYRALKARFCRRLPAGASAVRSAGGSRYESSPDAALSMGGFTSAPVLLAARRCGAAIFLHESNAVPGRANRLLSWLADQAFVGFPAAAQRLRRCQTVVTGTPVRPQFTPRNVAASRLELGLHPDRPVVLVVGGSQGASGLNEAVMAALPLFARLQPDTQWIHLAGPRDTERVKAAYAAARLPAIVLDFFDAMEVALGAATVAVSRSGASCLAELAAMRVPAVLVPFPAAADNHQWHNARNFEATGAARLLEQKSATPEMLTRTLGELLDQPAVRDQMRAALARWHKPGVAADIAEAILEAVAASRARSAQYARKTGACSCGCDASLVS
ncbi:MAG TPA: UDP-N-acetylglucosamine--N-acetylmuramyl-(pentapeptide) pyrophosphoryl-undecaprenol N-acetylglucosamine transferase [Verrucomicrobiae bacterium]